MYAKSTMKRSSATTWERIQEEVTKLRNGGYFNGKKS